MLPGKPLKPLRRPLALTTLICAALAVFACSPRPPESPATWRIIGPGGGGAQFHPTISPHDPNRVLVGCDMTGSYITHDAGASWRMFNLRLPSRFFVFDPVDSNTMYAQAAGLWRSTDAGETWNLLYPDPARVTGLDMSNDHASPRLTLREGTYGNVLALAVDPADSNSLYAAIQDGAAIHLQISADRGATWRQTDSLPGATRRIYIDPQSPAADRTLYILGAEGVAVRKQAAWRTAPLPAGVTAFVDASLGFPGDGAAPVIYAVTESHVYVSIDEGQSWTASSLPGESAQLQAVATSLHHPDVAYVSYNRLQLEGGEFLGVAKSADRAQSWELVWKDSREAGGENMDDGWIRERFGPTWGSNPFTLGVGPHNPEICYGTDFGRTMRTTDGGQSWTGVYSTRQPNGAWVSTGLDVTTDYGVHFDPFDKNRIFITYTDIGMFGSDDGGLTWKSASIGIPRRWTNTTYWIVFDPDVKGRVWGVASGVHDLPRPKMWRNRSPSTFNGGVVISHDGARNWEVSSNGMPQTAATHILLDPASPASNRVLYVAGYGSGVYKSVDGGKNWELRNNGITEDEPFAWRFTRDRDGLIYLVVARRSDEIPGALYKSADGADTWTTVPLPDGVTGPNGLAIDPGDPKRMYLAVWGRDGSQPAIDGGIYLSTDAGATWRNVLAKDRHVYDVTIDPADASILYAGGFESSAWRSADRGETWNRIPGYNFKWGHRVIPDPYNPGMIYVTTYGGSVWHGPAEGVPGAIEDIVTPVLRYSSSPGR